MSAGSDAPVDPRFANLDANATIELCSSLADYGEAGGLSRDLMLQVGRFAETRYGREIEVLLAVGRMYLLGGEAARARGALVRAGQLGLDEARIIPLLDQVLDQLDDPRTAEQALREAPVDSAPVSPAASAPASEPASPQRATGPRPAKPVQRSAAGVASAAPRIKAADESPGFPAVARRSQEPRVPAVKVTWDVPGRNYTPTTPMLRMPGHGPSKPTTPIARQGGHVTPAPAGARPTSPGGGGRTAAARAADQDTLAQSRPVRTEISRRVERSAATSLSSSPPPPLSGPVPSEVDDPDAIVPGAMGDTEKPATPGPLPRPARIRILDPDDDRRKLDPYELIGELASGGMATVYLGRLAGAGGFSRFVAIKQLHPHLAREEQFVQMFLDEARLAAGIHNAHVVPILEVGMSKAGYFLVMEFIEGDTLAGLSLRTQHVTAGSSQKAVSMGETPKPPGLPAPIAIRIVLDALAGLHAAHQLTDGEGLHLGLVHRDCTPQNILVGVDGGARLTDFGVARAASRLAITRPQQVKGKVAYLSPEQAHAMDLDRRSDLFTMGIVLWEALAGRSLFQADNEAVTLSRVVSGPIPAVRSFVPDLPAALDDVCRRALHRDRNKRFRTAAEMADALESAAEGVGVASPRDLGRFVETTMGPDLIAQREAVRAGLAPAVKSSHPSRPPPSLRGSAAGLSVRHATEPESPAPTPAVEPARLPAAEAPAEGASPGRVAIPPPPNAPPPAEPADPSPAAPAAEAAVVATAAPPESPRPPAAEPRDAPVAGPPAWREAAEKLLRQVTGTKLSTGRGAALALVLVILLTAPIWIKVTKRILHRRQTTGEFHGKPLPAPVLDVAGDPRPRAQRAAPSLPAPPSPSTTSRAQPAWDEGDWLPDAGAPPPPSAP